MSKNIKFETQAQKDAAIAEEKANPTSAEHLADLRDAEVTG